MDDDGERSANVRYRVNKDEIGYLVVEPKVPVRTYAAPSRAFYRGLRVSHENYSHSLFYDDEKEVMVHEYFDGTVKLEDFLKNLKTMDEGQGLPVLVFALKNVDGQIIEENDYVNPIYRVVIKSMVKFIFDQHSKYLALKSFGMDNLICAGHDIKSVDDIKFVDIKFVGIGFVDGSPASSRANFITLHQIVKNIFEGYSIPVELEHWLNSIMSLRYQSPKDGCLLLHHLALMSPKESVMFFHSCHETISTLGSEDSTSHEIAINKMGTRYNWSNKFTNGDPVFPTDECFRHRGKDGYYFYQSDINRDISSCDVTVSMLQCCRDIAVHIRRHSKDRLEYKDVERMIMHVFGRDLLELQKHLHDEDCLQPFVTNH